MKNLSIPAGGPGGVDVSLDIVAEKNLFRCNAGRLDGTIVNGFSRLGGSDLVAEDSDRKARGQQGIATVADELPMRLATVREQANPHSPPPESGQYRQHLDPQAENVTSS